MIVEPRPEAMALMSSRAGLRQPPLQAGSTRCFRPVSLSLATKIRQHADTVDLPEGGIRVPLIIKYPGFHSTLQDGAIVNAFATVMDILRK